MRCMEKYNIINKQRDFFLLQEKMTQPQLKTSIEQMRQYTGRADDAV